MFTGKIAIVITAALLLLILFSECPAHLSNELPEPVQTASSYSSRTPMPNPVIFGDGVISTSDDESHPAFTPDGKTLYFLKNTPTFSHWTIVVSSFAAGKWGRPEVAPFSGQYSDADPFITSDGKKLFFISKRPVDGKPKKDTDIWMMERTPAGWSEPKHLDYPVNSDGNEWFPTVTDAGTMYFGSDRPGGKGATDIWYSNLVNGLYGEPKNSGDAINSPAGEFEAYIAPDESFMIVAAAGRPDGLGAFDLYVSYNNKGIWSKLQNLGEKINSSAWDFSPKISPDGKYLFFSSNRGFTDQPLTKRMTYEELNAQLHSTRNGLRDIYQVDIGALGLKR